MDIIKTGIVIHGITEYKSNNVRFLFKEGKKEAPIIITFSAFPPRSTPQQYNYIKDFLNKEFTLFCFLDKDEPQSDLRGTYYLDKNCELSYLKDIDRIINQLTEIDDKHAVFLIGSSKGGVGALLFGLTHNYPNIIINAPQARIASYIKRRSLEISAYVSPSNRSFIYLDMFLIHTILQSDPYEDWNIHITCGEDDSYHLRELILIKAAFEFAQIPICTKIIRGGHDKLSIFDYRKYFLKIINKHYLPK